MGNFPFGGLTAPSGSSSIWQTEVSSNKTNVMVWNRNKIINGTILAKYFIATITFIAKNLNQCSYPSSKKTDVMIGNRNKMTNDTICDQAWEKQSYDTESQDVQ